MRKSGGVGWTCINLEVLGCTDAGMAKCIRNSEVFFVPFSWYAVFVLLSLPVHAQDADISGTVRDTAGAVISNASVNLVQRGHGYDPYDTDKP